MSFSSRRRNYLLTPHRRDGLIEWMKSMLQHSFVLDALETTADDTFRHFEALIEEHRICEARQQDENVTRHQRKGSNHMQQSRLRQLVPTIGNFHTPLPLREAFKIYNEKHKLTKRKHIQISFNEIRHILNLAQILALHRKCQPELLRSDSENTSSPLIDSVCDALSNSTVKIGENEEDTEGKPLKGPRLVTLDGDQTLYSDGANFDSNPLLAFFLYQLLRHQVSVAVVTAAGYEYKVERYEHRLSGLLAYFQQRGLSEEECGQFYLFGGECNYLLQLGKDYRLHPVKEFGPGGWLTSTKYLKESPSNWSNEEVKDLLDVSEETLSKTQQDLNMRGQIIRKRRSVGLVPIPGQSMTRESLDEGVLRANEKLQQMNAGTGPTLPYCAFNGGNDAWVDVGNKRVGVQILCAYLGIPPEQALHIGDQFLNTGNDHAARAICPCIWIINPDETTYILKSILRLAGVTVTLPETNEDQEENEFDVSGDSGSECAGNIDFEEIERRRKAAQVMDVYTGEMVSRPGSTT